MWVGRDALGWETAAPAEVASLCRDHLGINLSRQKVEGILSTRRDLAARRRIEGRWRYQIMRAGVEYASGASAGVLFVAPERALTQLRAVQDLLGSLEGVLRICDPYLSPRSLDFVVQCIKASDIRVLTGQVSGRSTFVGDLKATQSQLGVPVEVRVAAGGILHDRYIIHDSGVVLIGTSLNGLGNKQSVVVALGEDMRTLLLTAFDGIWAGAQQL
jgi:hypothetical protein